MAELQEDDSGNRGGRARLRHVEGSLSCQPFHHAGHRLTQGDGQHQLSRSEVEQPHHQHCLPRCHGERVATKLEVHGQEPGDGKCGREGAHDPR